MIRAVLDANVFVSAVVAPAGLPGRILAAWRESRFQLMLCGAILKEIAQVLRHPKIRRYHQWSEAQMALFVEDLAHLAVVVSPSCKLNIVRSDPADNQYLECALAADADYIVSGDRHLLQLETYEIIAIVRPERFLEMLEWSSERKPV